MKPESSALWVLKLYVAGRTPRMRRAEENLEKICREHLEGTYDIQIIDLLEQPRLAEDEQIVAVPALIRRLPTPLKQVVGDLSDTEKVLVGLDIRPGS